MDEDDDDDNQMGNFPDELTLTIIIIWFNLELGRKNVMNEYNSIKFRSKMLTLR